MNSRRGHDYFHHLTLRYAIPSWRTPSAWADEVLAELASRPRPVASAGSAEQVVAPLRRSPRRRTPRASGSARRAPPSSASRRGGASRRAGGDGRRASAGRSPDHPSRHRGSARSAGRARASHPGSARCGTRGRARDGTSRRPASPPPDRRGVARAGRSPARAPRGPAAVARSVASTATAPSSTRRARSVSTTAPSSSATAPATAVRARVRRPAKIPPPLPRRTSSTPACSSTRSAWRRVGFEIPSCSASSPSPGSRSPGPRCARSIASARCSMTASNVRVVRTGSIENATSLTAIEPSVADLTAKGKLCFTSSALSVSAVTADAGLRRVIGDGAGHPGRRDHARRRTGCSRSTARSCCCAHTTSGLSSTTARAGSAPTRSTGVTRRCRPGAVHALEPATGSSRATASRRSACSGASGRDDPVLVAWPSRPGGGTPPTSTSRRSAFRSPPRCRTPPGSRGA